MESSDVVVVGAGVIGCSAAFWLARAGLTVTVVERDGIAGHVSSLRGSPLLPLGELAPDGPIAAAGWASLEVWSEIEDELEDVAAEELRISRSGCLRLVDEARFREQSAELDAFGCSWLSQPELEELVPGLAPHFSGGLWSPREARADGSRLARALARGAEHYGARFALETPIVGLAISEGCLSGVLGEAGELFAAGEVVFCTGAWSDAIGPWLETEIPVESEPGLALCVSTPRSESDPVICAGGIQLVPGEAEVWVRGGEPAVAEPAALLEQAQEVVPSLPDRIQRRWAGSFSRTPDGRPLVGRASEVEGAVLAVGHGRHGVLLAALTGSGIAQLLVEGTLPDELLAFTPDR